MVCPPADVLSAFTSGELTDVEVAALELHLDACESCLAAVGVMGQSAAGIGGALELAPGAMVGRYQMLAKIGRGAFGVVYAAYDPQLDRKVALKLLRRRDAIDEERFLRETRAMARVSNPHVVAVHDVGRIDAGLFAAMEFIDGQTLTEWLATTPRTVREIVSAFCDAARGLAAAHATGIVHRDFKPDNVLVHRAGRVAVTDFGLARQTTPHTDEVTPVPSTRLETLTVEGTLVGTPSYMSPEALGGGVVDARSDLFSFCVVLYIALYREHPFRAITVSELITAHARLPEPPRDARVPRHLREGVLSGLHADPARRPQSMLALVRSLEHDPRRTRIKRAALGVTGVALVAAMIAAMSTSSPPLDCQERATVLTDEVWGPDRRTAVRAAIERSAAPLAGEAASRVEIALDRYATSWRTEWTASCKASEAAVVAPELLARRRSCLERRRTQWAALVATLQHPDASTIAGAPTAGYALPGVELCANPRWLSGLVSPQEDASLVTAYNAVVNAQVRCDLGAIPEGLAAIEGPLSIARATGDRALEAEALIVEGDLRRAIDPRAAETPLHAAAIAASAAGRLDLEARAKVLLVETLAHSQLRLAESRRAADYAEAAVTRLGDPVLIAEYLYARSLAEWSAGGAEQSIPTERLFLLTSLAIWGVDHPKVAEAENSIAVSLAELDEPAAALPLQRAALATRERLQGRDHPESLNARGNLAFVLAETGEIAKAVQLQEGVARDRARVLGQDYFLLSETWIRLSSLYQWELGRWREALVAARRAHDIDVRTFGADTTENVASLANLARVLAAQGDLDEADLASGRALAIARAGLPLRHLLVRTALATRGFVLERAGRCKDATDIIAELVANAAGAASGRRDLAFGLAALARCETVNGKAAAAEATLRHAVEVVEAARGVNSPIVVETLLELAALDLRSGRTSRALTEARRAVDLRAAVPGLVQARARFVLAQAEWASDPREARSEARRAAALLGELSEVPLRREIARWVVDTGP